MREELKNQLEELLSDESIFDEVQKVTSKEEFLALFEKKGITLSEDDLQDIFAQANVSEDGELSEDALEDVAGGSLFKKIVRFISVIPKYIRPLGGPIMPFRR